ncbi:MAG: mechanosensitive ion channel family protein [Candidatus Binataceae bacterium]
MAALVIGFVLHYLLVLFNRHAAKRSVTVLHESLERHCRKPLEVLLPALALELVLPAAHLPPQWNGVAEHAIGIIIIASTSWLLITLIFVVSDLILARYQLDERDSTKARRVNTQVQVFRRVFMVIIVVLAGATILMSFSWGRDIGTSVLASAGIAGIAVGLAARPTLENVVAGIQLAITQPISLEDAVIVENDWGWIEEITTTYVVVRTWDLRRWILPLTYFIQQPFQNWTRMTADLLGTIHLYVDYTAPIDAIRQEFTRLVQSSPRWDHKVCVLQVTEATAQTLQLRGLASAAAAGTAWDLRCEIREKLIEFIQRNYPQCLPKARAELWPAAEHALGGADGDRAWPSS